MVLARGAACQPRRCQVIYTSQPPTARRRFSDPHASGASPPVPGSVRRYACKQWGLRRRLAFGPPPVDASQGGWLRGVRLRRRRRIGHQNPAGRTKQVRRNFLQIAFRSLRRFPVSSAVLVHLPGSFSPVISASSPLLVWGSAQPVVPDPHPCFDCDPVGQPQAPGPFAISMQQRRTPPPRPPLRSNPKCEDKLFSCRT